MDSLYRFLTLGIPWAHSMRSTDVNVVTRVAEAYKRDTWMIKTPDAPGKLGKKKLLYIT